MKPNWIAAQINTRGILQRRQQRGMRPLPHFGSQHAVEHIALLRREPVRRLRPIGEQSQRQKAQGNAGQAHQKKQPLPSGETPDAVHLQQHAADRTADQRGQGNPDQEPGQHPRAVLGRKPGGEKERHARKEPGFRDPEQKTQAVKAVRPDHESGRRRHHAPADHDAGEPAPRAETIEHQVARHLEQRIAEKEDARGKPELGRRQPKLLVHGQRGKAKTGAIEIVEEIGDGQKRHEPQRGLPNGALQHGIRPGRP